MARVNGLLADTTPLRTSPPFRRLWWGLGISNLGSQLTVVAVGLQVYALTGSSLAVGVLGVCALVPLVALGLYGGALVDAYDRRKVALAASSALWVITALIALQAWLHLDSVGVLYGLVAAQSAAFAINNPARTAIVPRLVEPQLLPAANALQTLAWNVALTVGPLGGALLVALWGYQVAYTLDALLFTAALWAVWRLPDIPPVPTPATSGTPPPPARRRGRARVVGWRSVVDGLRYLGTQPNIRTTFLVDLAAMVLASPRVLLPAAGVLWLGGGEATTGVLTAAFAVGAVLASAFSGGLSRVRWQGRVIVWAITAYGASIVLFGLVLLGVGATSPGTVLVGWVVAACVALALAGASDAVSAVFRQTILQTAAPDEMRGRLQGVFIVVVAGGPRLGELVLGAQSTWVGEAWAAVLGGVACVVVLWVVVRAYRGFWRYDALHPEP
ncbi:MFS transporter [Cellulosimicrobium marinum]|uniref:MFS transporter n=1 Tax=Cellulosimicrobium marinum TaxID=1638992 RepID=UPI001E359684|nr:MFS transporter [Cellulosimicrobium marinum]MCB7135006.1 MFS transporter [Cellulosimicrobium marinum]